MRRALVNHPNFPPPAPLDLEVEVERPAPDLLLLKYRLSGSLSNVVVPRKAAPQRADELWQHTCFEVFVRAEGDTYYEFNFSPSGEWAGYRFGGYRSSRSSPDMPPPELEIAQERGELRLRASVLLNGVAELTALRVWQLGLSTIIEDEVGRRSYWALAHPPADPDFHHSDCFALELAAANTP